MSDSKKSAEKLDGDCRVVISEVRPEIEAGQFAIKRTVGDHVEVEADIFTDGHDLIAAVLLYRKEGETDWSEVPMVPLVNDRWRGRFEVTGMGGYRYTVLAWVDHFKSWQHDLAKKHKAGQDLSVDLRDGARLVGAAARRAVQEGTLQLTASARALTEQDPSGLESRIALALSPQLAALMAANPDRQRSTRYVRELCITVDPELARFGAWYELFPRSLGKDGKHGTLDDVIDHLPRVAEMGFDVLYLPPIHPVGRAFRKGKNNNPECQPGEPGSPWAIGAIEGGHKSILPELGTLADFGRLVMRARELKIEIALDIAFQCAPDHPYVKAHPDWFRQRSDGSIQYAENPPKKYQDIYPFDFESGDWKAMWLELKSVFEFWHGQGVTVFRVDNPHTKAFPFWQWCITELKKKHPEMIFLSEAFTRPKVMYRLAKAGFTQSYNYFPWRNTKKELTEYLTELTRTEVSEFLRPNLWPNTPDILPLSLQYGGRPAFMSRLILAATLGASYGIYGPAYELCVNQSRAAGAEEYLDSEKYEIRSWNLNLPGNLTELIRRVNQIRRDNPALHRNDGLEFHPTDNDQMIAFSKSAEGSDNLILVVVNLDPHHVQSGWLTLPVEEWDIAPTGSYQVHDLLTDGRYLWNGARNFVQLDPAFAPAHVFRLRRRVCTEESFDYYL